MPALLILAHSGISFAAPEANGKQIKKPVTITSTSMEASSDRNVVHFKGNVVAEEDFTLCSDELFVYYGENKEVNEIIASGNVEILQNDKTARSAKAVYDRVGRTLVLTGDPQVRQCTDTISGDKITVFIDKDDALVESESGGRVKAVIMPEKKCENAQAPDLKGESEKTRCKGTR